MSSLEVLTGSPFLSHSSLTTFLNCPQKYRLQKVLKVDEGQSWALIAGSAVHAATQMVDEAMLSTGERIHPFDAWAHVWSQELADIEDVSKVRPTGRKTKQWPAGKDAAYWSKMGPEHVTNWVTWRDERLAEGWQLDAIELAMHVEMDGVAVRGFIDRVMSDPGKQRYVVDLKSGEKVPDPLQLAMYSIGMSKTDFGAAEWGTYLMTNGPAAHTYQLTRWTEEKVGSWLKQVKTAIELELFPPNMNSYCSSCTVRDHCEAWAE